MSTIITLLGTGNVGVDRASINSNFDNLNTDKVEVVAGKGLSEEDYTTVEQSKLSGIAAGAQVNTVTSVAAKTGAVTLVKGDVGLGSVDNTSDADKPVSTAQQTALDLKEDKVAGKGLSEEDYTTVDQSKLAGIEAGADVNTINSATAGEPTGSDVVLNVVSLTTAEHAAGTPVATTLYLITDA